MLIILIMTTMHCSVLVNAQEPLNKCDMKVYITSFRLLSPTREFQGFDRSTVKTLLNVLTYLCIF